MIDKINLINDKLLVANKEVSTLSLDRNTRIIVELLIDKVNELTEKVTVLSKFGQAGGKALKRSKGKNYFKEIGRMAAARRWKKDYEPSAEYLEEEGITREEAIKKFKEGAKK